MKETLLVGTILVALSVLFGYHGIHSRQRAEVAQLEAKLRVERERQQAKAKVAGVVREIERFGRRLSPTPDPSWLVGEVVKVADAAGVQLTSIVHEAHQRDLRGVTHLGVSVRFDATYHELGAFLDSLERTDSLIRIDNVRVSAEERGRGQGFVQVTVSTLHVPPVRSAVRGGLL